MSQSDLAQSAPAPILDFVARFEASPNAPAQPDFLICLLDLEVRRAMFNVMSNPARFEVTEAYKADIIQADRILKFARCHRMFRPEQMDIPYHWLTLLGRRIAVEQGVFVEGFATLARVAAARLDLPLKTTEAWDEDTLFRRYTRTVLRAEWDYPGLGFRPSQGAAF